MSTIVKLSEQLLYNVKLSLPFKDEVDKLSTLNYNNLLLELETDNLKKTFWINIYNAFYQILTIDIQNKTIYSQKIISIASFLFSLDAIEHGILRKGKFVVGFGYLNNPFYPNFIKKLQVNILDYRIHFALNCGAVSCPPILVYEFSKIEQQLQLATYSFLEAETTINTDKKMIITSKLLFWYKGDFGSNRRIKQIISTIFEQDLKNYNLIYRTYDWTLKLHNFK